METNKMILGVYDDPDQIYSATKKLVKNGYSVHDVYSPFAIHGIDRVIGIKRSRLTVAAFIFSMCGVACALTLMMYTSGYDWKMNIGGKPFFHVPNYIPITFELGVLFTAFGMVTCFFIVNRMFWGKNADIIDLKVTDDKFVVAVNINKNTNTADLNQLLIDNGAIEVRERTKEI